MMKGAKVGCGETMKSIMWNEYTVKSISTVFVCC